MATSRRENHKKIRGNRERRVPHQEHQEAIFSTELDRYVLPANPAKKTNTDTSSDKER